MDSTPKELTPAPPLPPSYLAHYGLHTAPFPAASDAGVLWLGRSHRAALWTLTTALEQSDGLLVLTGDPGTGKTSVANHLSQRLARQGTVIGRIPDAGVEPLDLLRAIAGALGTTDDLASKPVFVDRFRQWLGGPDAKQKKVLLVVDDAQGLSHELLEEIHELLDVGARAGHPLSILLVGQNELNDTLFDDLHAELRQRIIARCLVEPFTLDEVGDYVRQRLKLAGAEKDVFSLDAIPGIASISRGSPGVINTVCDRALVVGHDRQAQTIDREIIEECFGPLRSPGSGTGGRRRQQLLSERGQIGTDEEHAVSSTTLENISPLAQRDVEMARTPRVSTRAGLLVGALAAALLVAGGYWLYTSRLTGSPHEAAREASPSQPAEERATTNVPSTEPAATPTAGGTATSPGSSGERPPAQSAADRPASEPPSPVVPQSPTSASLGASDTKKPPEHAISAEMKAGASRKAEAPTASKGVAGGADRRKDPESATDPAPIIDWLLKESPSRSR